MFLNLILSIAVSKSLTVAVLPVFGVRVMVMVPLPTVPVSAAFMFVVPVMSSLDPPFARRSSSTSSSSPSEGLVRVIVAWINLSRSRVKPVPLRLPVSQVPLSSLLFM